MRSTLRSIADDTSKVNLLNKLSPLYIEENLDSLLYYARTARILSERLKYPKGRGDAFKNIATYYQNKGEYNKAMDMEFNAIKEYEKVGANSRIAGAYLSLALISKDISGGSRTDEYVDMALSYARSGYDICKKEGDTVGLISSLITTGVIYRDKALTTDKSYYYDSAFLTYTTALRLIQNTGKGEQNLSKLYNNISQVYTEYKKDYRAALSYLFKAVDLNLASDKKVSLSHNYGNISDAYIKFEDPDNALKYARTMLAISEKLNRPERIQNALYQMFKAHRANHHCDSAHYYYVMADGLNDSLTNVTKARQVIELQTQYETGRKEAAIKQLNIESEHNSKRIVLLITALVVFAALSIGMVWLYGRIRRQKRKITQQSKDLEIVMKELHHRVKNNLQIVSSLLNLQAYKLEDETAVSALKESQMRVQAMSLIHQRLYKADTLTNVNIKDYITDLAETLMSAYGYSHDNFDLRLNISHEMIDVDRALPIGLIINELVTNAMKYAFKNVARPILYIELSDNGHNIMLTVRDNGPGINEAEWKKKAGSFGKQLIQALSKQLRAQQTLSVQNGTAVTISFPNKEKAA